MPGNDVTGSGRLSLRARLLVLLIVVTMAFLVVMGGVTTFVLSRQLNAQFNAGLLAAAAAPRTLADAQSGDVAAVVSFRTRQVTLLTPGSLGTRFQQVLERTPMAQFRADYGAQPFTLLAGGTRLRAVERVVLGSRLRRIAALPPGRFLLVVGRPLSTLTGQVHTVVLAELITGTALLLLLAGSGRWLIGRGLHPLTVMAGTAQRITRQGDLAARMPDAEPSTEVGRLGAAINTMLDRIQQAFHARLASEQKVRQFAADASHELRTPLTTIRGYAELYRQGALGPGELPDAMRRIEQEAQRMSTLVAELLELARLDQTSSLDLAETDLAALVRDATADARAVEPQRPVHAEAPDRLLAVVDEARIRQVLANLLGNVREHTPRTTPVAVRLARAPGGFAGGSGAQAAAASAASERRPSPSGGIVLEVADAGPGMSREDAARAFDRFHRGSDLGGSGGNGGNSRGGSGLGLSIVQAIARAHGGEAVLESQPGLGTRVRVWLPTATS